MRASRLLAALRRPFSSSTPAPAPAPAPAPPRDLAGIAVFSGLTLLTLGLAGWQARRYGWKVRLVEERQRRLALPPVDVTSAGGAARLRHFDSSRPSSGGHGGGGSAEDEADAAALLPTPHTSIASPEDALAAPPLLELQRVLLRGRFERGSPLALIGPRPPPKDLAPSLVSTANAGVLAVRALRRPDGSRVLVLRGWVPADRAAEYAEAGDDGAEVAVTGVLRRSEHPSVFVPRHEEARSSSASAGAEASVGTGHNAAPHEGMDEGVVPTDTRVHCFHYVDAALLARSLGLSEERGDQAVLIEALREEGDKGEAAFPAARGVALLQDVHVPPSTHLVYAATWLSLALCGTALTAARFRGGRRGRR